MCQRCEWRVPKVAGFEQTNLWRAIQTLIENDKLIGMLYSVKETSAKKRGINDETTKRHLVPQRDAHGKQCLTLAHFPITVSLTFTLWFEWVVITTGPMETSNYRAKSYPASHSEPYVPLKQHLDAFLLTGSPNFLSGSLIWRRADYWPHCSPCWGLTNHTCLTIPAVVILQEAMTLSPLRHPFAIGTPTEWLRSTWNPGDRHGL